MINVSPESSVGYAIIDAEGRMLASNSRFASISDGFLELEAIQNMVSLVRKSGYVVRGRAYPMIVDDSHLEKRFLDFSFDKLEGESELVLVHLREVPPPEQAKDDIIDLLHKAALKSTLPIGSGEDMEGRAVDIYVHPSTSILQGRVTVIAIYRDSRHNLTFEFDASLFERLALAHALHVKS